MIDYKFIFTKQLKRQIGRLKPASHPEPKVFDFLKKIHGNVFVDIGANNGQYSHPLSKHFHRVIAVEPDWRCSVRGHNIELLAMVMSDKSGKETLFFDENHCPTIMKDARYRPVSHPEIDVLHFNKGESFEVASITFDSYFPIGTVDLVKIDGENAEFKILDGMKKSLTENRIRRICVELHDRERKQELTDRLLLHFNRLIWLDDDHLYADNQVQVEAKL